MWVALIACFLYIAWSLRQLYKLDRWLQHKKLTHIPESSGIWGNIYDALIIDKKRQAREKKRLKSIIMRVETMTAALNDAVILLSEDNTISWLNKSSRKLLTLKKTDINRPITNFIRNPLFVNYLDKGDYELPLILPAADNIEQRLEFRLNRFGEGEGLLIVRDITRLHKLEQMRKDFVGNVTHELRTPLTVIKGYLETLEDARASSKTVDDRWEKPIQQMQQQASRMTTLINDLTMLSKLETEEENKKNTVVLLNPLLKMICDEAMTISGDNQNVIHLSCDSAIAIIGNDRELHSAFSNLILNAVKYSLPNKPINIEVNKNFVDGVDIKVIDNGIGIEHHHISRLTERFYRVDSSRSIETGGTGLGLAIVKHILARHEARLRISSRINQGSTFTAIFPASRVTTNTEK